MVSAREESGSIAPGRHPVGRGANIDIDQEIRGT
jgi:hypothetical protein